jgi:hypothetical protein
MNSIRLLLLVAMLVAGVSVLIFGAFLPLAQPRVARDPLREAVASVCGLALCVAPALLVQRAKGSK